MADAVLTREILAGTSTDTVDRDVGPLGLTLAEGILEEYESPFAGTGDAQILLNTFTEEHVSPWIGLAVMKRESSFGNKANNKDLDERNLADPYGVHFNEKKDWPDGAKKNLLLVQDAHGSYVSKTNPAASVVGYRLPTFQESTTRCAVSIHNRSLIGYNPRGREYKAEIDDHLSQILRHTYGNHRLRDELDRIFAVGTK